MLLARSCPNTFYTMPLEKVRGIMLYPRQKNLHSSVIPSVNSTSFPGSILNMY